MPTMQFDSKLVSSFVHLSFVSLNCEEKIYLQILTYNVNKGRAVAEMENYGLLILLLIYLFVEGGVISGIRILLGSASMDIEIEPSSSPRRYVG